MLNETREPTPTFSPGSISTVTSAGLPTFTALTSLEIIAGSEITAVAGDAAGIAGSFEGRGGAAGAAAGSRIPKLGGAGGGTGAAGAARGAIAGSFCEGTIGGVGCGDAGPSRIRTAAKVCCNRTMVVAQTARPLR